MCGRFVAASDPDGLMRFFVIDDRRTDDVPPSWNVAPTDRVHAVAEHAGRRALVAFRWGLVPSWADGLRAGAKMINARAETVMEKPAFRESFARRRCLVPADGFYEWRTDASGRTTPYFVSRADGAPLAFAGLWASWRDRAQPGAERVRSCAIVTTRAAESLSALHDRMPVILPREAWDEWLDPGHDHPEALRRLLEPVDDGLTFHAVDPAVGNVRVNHPGLIAAAPSP